MGKVIAERISEIILWTLILASGGYGSYKALEVMAFAAAKRMDVGFNSLEDLSKRLNRDL